MKAFLYGHSSDKQPHDLVADCLSQTGAIPAEANFGFIYATDVLTTHLEDILDVLKQSTGIENWTGTVGFGVSSLGVEYYDQAALAIMVGHFPASTFKTIPLQHEGIGSFIETTADWLNKDECYFGILHADPSSPHTSQLITQIAEHTPNGFFVGGLTSASAMNAQITDSVTSGGVSGVIFSSETPVVVGHTQGCTPFASKHVVTACEQNIIIELDNKPALDVFEDDIGEVMVKDLQRVAGYIFVGFPIPGSDTGDYMVRNLTGIDRENKLIAVGEMLTEGADIMFCRRDGNTAREDMLRMLTDIKARLGGTPKGAVYYSCTGRGRYQFGNNSEELKIIQGELGDLPLVGFFANGEIFHNRLYGYTGVLTVFC